MKPQDRVERGHPESDRKPVTPGFRAAAVAAMSRVKPGQIRLGGVPMLLVLEGAESEPGHAVSPPAMADLVLNVALVAVAEAYLGEIGAEAASQQEVCHALEVAAEFCLVAEPYGRRVP